MTPNTSPQGDSSQGRPKSSLAEDDRLDVRIDKTLNKYVFVWIWSVLFGTATGAALTFANYRLFGKYRAAELLFAVLTRRA